jgi:hypothetical protein
LAVEVDEFESIEIRKGEGAYAEPRQGRNMRPSAPAEATDSSPFPAQNLQFIACDKPNVPVERALKIERLWHLGSTKNEPSKTAFLTIERQLLSFKRRGEVSVMSRFGVNPKRRIY